MQRILSVQYSIPDNVQISPECRNLISRIFVFDPTAVSDFLFSTSPYYSFSAKLHIFSNTAIRVSTSEFCRIGLLGLTLAAWLYAV